MWHIKSKEIVASSSTWCFRATPRVSPCVQTPKRRRDQCRWAKSASHDNSAVGRSCSQSAKINNNSLNQSMLYTKNSIRSFKITVDPNGLISTKTQKRQRYAICNNSGGHIHNRRVAFPMPCISNASYTAWGFHHQNISHARCPSSKENAIIINSKIKVCIYPSSPRYELGQCCCGLGLGGLLLLLYCLGALGLRCALDCRLPLCCLGLLGRLLLLLLSLVRL